MSEVTIYAFDQDYSFPRSNLDKSEVLSAAFSGRYNNSNRYELPLADEYQTAFNIVYAYLNDPRLDLPTLDEDLLIQILTIADYLIMPELIAKLINLLNTNDYSEETLLIFLKTIHPKAEEEGIKMFLQQHSLFWNNFSPLLQSYFRFFLNQNPEDPTNLPLIYRTVPYSANAQPYAKVVSSLEARVCQRQLQPIPIQSLPDITLAIREGQDLVLKTSPTTQQHYYYICPSSYPKYRSKRTRFTFEEGPLYCCSRPLGDHQPQLDPSWGNLQAAMTDQGWIVLVNSHWRGDFVVIWEPIVFQELRLIVDLSAL